MNSPVLLELAKRERDRRLYRSDPVGFVRHYLGEKTWGDYVPDIVDKQAEVLQAIGEHDHVAVKAANGVGKTWLAARVVAWFMETQPNPIAITTAPTWRQVDDLLWKEIRSLYRTHAKLRGVLMPKAPRIDIDEESYAVGFSTNDPNNFQGYHAESIIIIIDEGPGVDTPIWEASGGVLRGGNAKILTLGNPTTSSGPFHEAFHAKSDLWSTHTITAFDHPNVSSREILIPGAVTAEDIEVARIDWGEGTPSWQARVLGEFPDQSEDQLISVSMVEEARFAQSNDVNDTVEDEDVQKWAGLDIARYGADRSVLIKTVDGVIVDTQIWEGKSLMHSAGKAVQAIKQGFVVNVDDAGLGGGVTDRLEELGYRKGQQFHPINAGSAPVDKKRYPKLRDELWGDLKTAFLEQRIDLSQMDEHLFRTLQAEMVATKYSIDSAGRIKIESKDQMKKRGLRSPDFADALCLAFHRPRRTGLIFAGVV